MGKLSIAKKISLILLAAFLCLTLLEFGLRFAGFIALQIREHRNNISLKAKKECVILCLRDSVNAWSKEAPWPSQLESLLNDRDTGIRFRVVDKALDAAPSSALLYSLDESISQYKPDMVIAMMGIYDGDNIVPFKDIYDVKFQSFLSGFKFYNSVESFLSNKSEKAVSKKIEELKDIVEVRKTPVDYMNKAEVELKKEIDTEPGDYELYASLGHFYNTQGKYQQAEEAFKKSLEINPDNESPYNGLGDCYYAQDGFQQAENMFKKALEIRPNDDKAFFALINTYEKQDNYELAEELFKKAIERDPNNENRYLQLGNFYKTQGKYLRAEEMFKKVVEINPDNDIAYESLGYVYSAQGKRERAEGVFKKLKTGSHKRYLILGSFYNTEGMYKEAEKELKKAIDLNPNNFETYITLGDNYTKQGKYQLAEEALRKAIEINSQNNEGYVRLGYNFKVQGKYEQAEKAFEKATWLNPGCEEAYVQLGRCYMELKMYKEAIETLEKGISLSPEDDDIYVTLALCYSDTKLGNEPHQEDLLTQALQINPKCDSAYIELGSLYTKQARYRESEEALEKAIELKPKNNAKPILELGYCYIKQGKSEQLQDLLDKISDSKTKDDRIYSFLAVNYQEQGDLESAQKFFKEADKLRLSYYSPQTRHSYEMFNDILRKHNIRLVSVQYPMRSLKSLKKILGSAEGVIFVDNEKVFQDALRQSKYKDYFQDYFAGDFGTYTSKSEELLVRNIAETILREIF